MNSAAYDNIFARASARDPEYVEVLMDQAKILKLNEGRAGAIATRRLGGCSGVVILGRTAAIMAHIAPLPSRQSRTQTRLGTVGQSLSPSEQHFRSMLREAEDLYTNNRPCFPPESTVWGFFLANFESVTDDLKALASRHFATIGLNAQYIYYDAHIGPDRQDQVRVAVHINGSGKTSFHVETRQIESVHFESPLLPLPDRHASQTLGSRPTNYLRIQIDLENPKLEQVYLGTVFVANRSRLSGWYDVLCVHSMRGLAWRKHNFDTGSWGQG